MILAVGCLCFTPSQTRWFHQADVAVRTDCRNLTMKTGRPTCRLNTQRLGGEEEGWGEGQGGGGGAKQTLIKQADSQTNSHSHTER